MKGIWKEVSLWITPGGDPLWECPFCHNGRHVYGVECIENYTHICRDCGAELMYPWEDDIAAIAEENGGCKPIL